MPSEEDTENHYQRSQIWIRLEEIALSLRRFTFRNTIALLLFAALLIMSGCGGTPSGNQEGAGEPSGSAAQTPAPEDAKPAPRMIPHELGETPVEGTPERVVVLEYSFVDALASVGVSPVGIADDGKKENVVPQLRSLIQDWTSVGTRAQPNLEIISSLEPDLIIADLRRHKDIYEKLSKIAPTIVLKSLESSYEENLASLAAIGEALNKADQMQQRLEQHQQKMADLAQRVPPGEARKVMAAVVTDNLFNVHTSVAYTPGVLKTVGLAAAIEGEPGAAYAKLNLEQLVEIDPDVIFLMASPGAQLITDEWAGNPLWQNLKAVKAGAVYKVDRDLWSKMRGVIAAEAIAEEAIRALYGE